MIMALRCVSIMSRSLENQMIALTSSNYLPLAASLIVVLVGASSASVTSNAYENIAFQDRANSDNTQFVKIYNTYDEHNFLPLRNGQKLFSQSDACPIGKLSICLTTVVTVMSHLCRVWASMDKY